MLSVPSASSVTGAAGSVVLLKLFMATMPVRLTRLAMLVTLPMVAACGPAAPVESATDVAPATPVVAELSDSGLAQLVGTAPPANGAIVSIILFDPHTEIDVPVPDEVPVMDQFGRTFNPLFLLVRRGQTVRFTNSEDDVHTVHVKDGSGETLFNVATLFGSTYEFTFDHEDSYDVVCNTHTEMQANILVVSSPYAVLADSDGIFTVRDMLPGTYTVTMLNGEDRYERDVKIVAGRNDIDLTGV